MTIFRDAVRWRRIHKVETIIRLVMHVNQQIIKQAVAWFHFAYRHLAPGADKIRKVAVGFGDRNIIVIRMFGWRWHGTAKFMARNFN